MVPIRIELDGFLSYRDKQALTFDGSPLWMLSGPNGAGKSSVFDAITYSLYGLHRGGLQQHAELINHGRDEMAVQFDFSLGESVFRIKRTQSRRNRSSCEAFSLQDGVPVPIAETSLREGFKRWIEETVGLDANAFTTSVLLQQNKSDALLAADPKTRHGILSQIVDLSAYQGLHDEVKSQHSMLSQQAKVLDSQLAGMERIDPAEIERLGDAAARAREASQQCVEKLQELSALRVHSLAWHKNAAEKHDLDRALAHVRGLLDRASQVTERHERWSELKIHLPTVERALALEDEAKSLSLKYLEAQRAGEAWRRKRDEATATAQAARESAAGLGASARSWRDKGHAARESLDALAEPLREVEALAQLESEAEAIEARLDDFAPGFEDEIAQARQESAELSEIALALPALKQFGRARKAWNEMRQASSEARAARAKAESELAISREEIPTLAQRFERDDEALEEARADEVRVRGLLKGERERASKLASAHGLAVDATCERCGSPLDALHLEEERERREERVAELMGELAGAEAATAQARGKREASRLERERAEREAALAQDGARAAEGEIRNLKGKGLTLCDEVERVIEALPARFRERFAADVAKPAEHFKSEFPSADEVRALDNRATKKPSLERTLQVLAAQEKERDALLARALPLNERLAPLRQKYSPEERSRLTDESQGARATIALARERAGEAEQQQSVAEAERDDAGARSEAASRVLSELDVSAERDRALEGARREERAEMLSRLEPGWKVLAQAASAEDVARLKRELAGLAGAPDEMAALSAARESLSAQVARSAELAQVLEATPHEHRRPPEDVEAEEQAAQKQKSQADATASECESEKQKLQSDDRRRQEVIEEIKSVTKSERLHESLSKQLGPNALQRYLLQQAEALIVENANRLLDTMSGGVLQIQLKADEEAPSNGRAATPKALEMLAINQETGARPMPVEFLSGSQKFRVAVALALGIGQFASAGGRGDNKDGHQGGRRIESVIIDEGFGSLDQEGRENIVNELRALGSVLKRVIVVSHQEELARAFPSRYQITLQDGTSVAQVVEADS